MRWILESNRKCNNINGFPAFVLENDFPKNLFLGGGFRFWGCFWENKTG